MVKKWKWEKFVEYEGFMWWALGVIPNDYIHIVLYPRDRENPKSRDLYQIQGEAAEAKHPEFKGKTGFTTLKDAKAAVEAFIKAKSR
jgi:hypothetical protein